MIQHHTLSFSGRTHVCTERRPVAQVVLWVNAHGQPRAKSRMLTRVIEYWLAKSD